MGGDRPWRRLNRYPEWCLFGIPDNAPPWRRLSCRHIAFRRGRGQRMALLLVLALSWPLRCLVRSVASWRRLRRGPGVGAEAAGYTGLVTQFFYSLRSGVPPIHYYRFGFHDSARRLEAAWYLYDHEIGPFFAYLNRFRSHPAIDDKIAFSRFCVDHGIPSIPVVATFSLAECPGLANEAEVPAGDLFSKPAEGFQGRGAARWRKDASGRYLDSQGAGLTLDQLWERLDRLSREQALLLQPALQSHPALTAIADGGLITARLITARVGDEVEYLIGIAKIPRRGAITNNNGLAAPINGESGRLGAARAYRPGAPPFAVNPDNGAEITGVTVPDWPRIREMVCRAHRELPGIVFIGWDVALSDRGPLLMEANLNWEATMIQLAHDQPLGKTRFLPIVLEVLRRRAEEAGLD